MNIGFGAVIGVAVVGFVIYLAYQFTSKSGAGNGNPVSKAADKLVAQVTGDKNQTVGGLVHDKLNPRAGLAAGESSPAPGIIVQAPKLPSAPEPTAADIERFAADLATSGL